MSKLTTLVGWYDKLPEQIRTTIWSAGRAFLGAELVLIPTVLAAPSLGAEEQVFLAGTFAAGTAAVRLIQHALQTYTPK